MTEHPERPEADFSTTWDHEQRGKEVTTCRWCCKEIEGEPTRTRLFNYCGTACADDHTLYLLRSQEGSYE